MRQKNQISTIIENGCQHDWILIKLGSDQPYLAQQIVHIVAVFVMFWTFYIYRLWFIIIMVTLWNIIYFEWYIYFYKYLVTNLDLIWYEIIILNDSHTMCVV